MKEPETETNINVNSTPGKKRMVYSIIVAVCAVLLIVATVLTVYFVTQSRREVIDNENPGIEGDGGNEPAGPGEENPGENQGQPAGPGEEAPGENQGEPAGPGSQEPENPEPPKDDKPSGGEKVAFVKPVDTETCSVGYNEVYNNKSLDRWYKHKAMDFVAEVGAPVFAMADGVVKEISLESVLGNYIILEHADGITTLYRFVEPIEGLNEGDEVKQGQTIATVAEAYGTEYKDGVHLHLEMKKEGEHVDPNDYIDVTYEEK